MASNGLGQEVRVMATQNLTQADRDKLLIEISGTVRGMSETVRRPDRAIYGNGQPGLVDRVSHLEQGQKDCPARKRNWLAIVATSAAVVSAIGCIGAVVVALLG